MESFYPQLIAVLITIIAIMGSYIIYANFNYLKDFFGKSKNRDQSLSKSRS